MKCEMCDVSLTSEGVTDGINLCHPCYIATHTVYCGDCLVPINQCNHGQEK